MKKLAVWAALAALLLGTAPLTALAEGEEGMAVEGEVAPPEAAPAEDAPAETTPADLFEYSVTPDGFAKLTKFKPGASYTGEVEIPSKIDDYFVIDLANGCFMECSGITCVKFPDDVTDIGSDVFLGCTSLERFEVAAGNPYFSVKDGVLYGDEEKFLIAYPAAKEGENFSTPAGVEEIAPGAFGFAQNLREITVSEGVTHIDSWAFAHCPNLEKVSIPATMEQIDDYAFAYCDKLSDVRLAEGLQKIYNATFAYCPSLIQITLPSTIEHIGQYAFCATGLTCVTIPSRVERVDYCAFGYDADFNPVSGFTVYGEKNSFAQEYCTASDPENDYQNHFKFVEIENADQPYELQSGEFEAPDGVDNPAAPDAEETELRQEGEPSASEKLGAGLMGSPTMKLLLGVGGGILVLVAVILIVAYSLSPKRKVKKASNKKNESK